MTDTLKHNLDMLGYRPTYSEGEQSGVTVNASQVFNHRADRVRGCSLSPRATLSRPYRWRAEKVVEKPSIRTLGPATINPDGYIAPGPEGPLPYEVMDHEVVCVVCNLTFHRSLDACPECIYKVRLNTEPTEKARR